MPTAPLTLLLVDCWSAVFLPASSWMALSAARRMSLPAWSVLPWTVRSLPAFAPVAAMATSPPAETVLPRPLSLFWTTWLRLRLAPRLRVRLMPLLAPLS